MMKSLHIFTAALVAIAVSSPAYAAAPAGKLPCASPADASVIQGYYTSTRPGAPLAVPGRSFSMPELTVASGLSAQQAVGAAGTVENVRKVWESINGWGARTKVALVLTSGGRHAYNFPSLVPMLLPDTGENWIDAEADGGAGVHAHMYSPLVKAIYATQTEKAPGAVTRGITFYDAAGNPVLAVYAQVEDKPFDQAAVDGFAKTWALIGSMPRVCTR